MIELVDVPFGIRFVGYGWGFGQGNQVPVRTFKEVKDIVSEFLGTDNLGISMCTYKDGMPYLLFLPFDFDSADLRESWNDSSRMYNKLVKKGYTVCLTFSGQKGFHIFIKTVPKIYTKKHIRAVQKYFKEMLNLKTLDENIFGDVRRLMRIPNTYNMKGKLCRIIACNTGKELDLNDLIDAKNIKDDSGYVFDTDYDTYEIREYPCIERLIKDKDYWRKNHPRGGFEPSQPVRYTWVTLRILEGKSEDEIIAEAESFGWDDYDESKTRYQIRHIGGRGYIPYSCSTLRDMGLCIVDNCKYMKVDKCFLKELKIL